MLEGACGRSLYKGVAAHCHGLLTFQKTWKELQYWATMCRTADGEHYSKSVQARRSISDGLEPPWTRQIPKRCTLKAGQPNTLERNLL